MSKFGVSNFVDIQYNLSGYTMYQMVSVCKRHNNSKRDYLFVNKLQGKHVPVVPSEAVGLFKKLAEQVNIGTKKYNKIAVIGFAETATAIGRYVALNLPNCKYRGQTTREVLEGEQHLIDFEEAHSHAVSQSLYGDIEKIKDCDLVLFVEDEITTGNTIIDFIDKFKELVPDMKYAVASILNWQSKENEEKFSELDIETYCLVRGAIKDEHAKIKLDKDEPITSKAGIQDFSNVKVVKHKLNDCNFKSERTLTGVNKPIITTSDMLNIANIVEANSKVLVLGTEEYMFAGLKLAHMIETCITPKVKFQATTRSPIVASKDKGYVLNNKFRLHSAYDSSRETYLYNIERYNTVIVVTDIEPSREFMFSVASTYSEFNKNVKIVIVSVE